MEYARMRKQRTRLRMLVVILMFLIAAAAAAYYYLRIYMNEIQSVEGIDIRAKQNSRVYPPDTVEVRLKSGEAKKVPVKWNSEEVDTSSLGLVELKGQIEGYSKYADMRVRVYHYIERVEKPGAICLVDSKSLKLPQYVSVYYSMKSQGKEKVIWDMGNLDLSIPGSHQIKGMLESGEECPEEIYCDLEVIDRDEALKRIIVQNEFVDNDKVKRTMDRIKELPGDILEMLVKSEIKIRYVAQKITDMKEFSSLKTAEDNDLMVYGAFNYPNIVVDVRFNEEDPINSFDTVTIHEIGHAYDYLYNVVHNSSDYKLSSTSQFYSTWKNEAPQLFNSENSDKPEEYLSYYTNSKDEYFAQSFAYYFCGDETRNFLKEKAPESYEFIKDRIEK
ncbi:MAG: Ig-like domain-containing protein [Bacillota bacterium]|nr:Ig-like domain-containing protein [Bacillota bacterium]